jgi:outer membrane protein assembly factor BamE (lipoprotein component of BamABCDE complex)
LSIEKLYAKTEVGMTRQEVVKILGEPTTTLESEMFYLYDDPEKPVRLRYVLNEREVVSAKYYETQKDLLKKAEETVGEIPVPMKAPGEEPQPVYPGGPLPRFQKKPGMP